MVKSESANQGGVEATNFEMRDVSGEIPGTTIARPKPGEGTFLAVAGIIGPVLFTALIILAGFLRTGYSQLGGAGISELGVGPNAVIWNAGAVAFGLLMIIFAFGLHKVRSQGKSPKLGPTLVGVSGAGFVGLGLFPAYGATLPFHQSFALVVFVSSILAPLFIIRNVGRDRDLWRYRNYSMITGIGALLALLTFIAGVQLQITSVDLNAISQGIQVTPQGALGAWAGLIQRIFFLIVWSWIEVTALLLTLGRLGVR